MSQLLEQFILPSLITTSDMAYVEEASGTRGMLKLIEKLVRYELDEHNRVLVVQEVEVARAILDLCRYRFGSFESDLLVFDRAIDMEINKYTLISDLIPMMNEIFTVHNCYTTLKLLVDWDDKTGTVCLVRR